MTRFSIAALIGALGVLFAGSAATAAPSLDPAAYSAAYRNSCSELSERWIAALPNKTPTLVSAIRDGKLLLGSRDPPLQFSRDDLESEISSMQTERNKPSLNAIQIDIYDVTICAFKAVLSLR